MRIVKTIGFWLASYTWGFIMTIIGTFVAFILLITKHRPKVFECSIYFEVGQGWGGASLGPFILVSKNSSTNTKIHEFGHGIQNIIFGPLMPFLVCIPSALRYQVRSKNTANDKIYFLAAVLSVALILPAVPLLIIVFNFLIGWPLVVLGLWLVYDLSLFFWQLSEIKRFVKNRRNEEYDKAWFEGWATQIGTKGYLEF